MEKIQVMWSWCGIVVLLAFVGVVIEDNYRDSSYEYEVGLEQVKVNAVKSVIDIEIEALKAVAKLSPKTIEFDQAVEKDTLSFSQATELLKLKYTQYSNAMDKAHKQQIELLDKRMEITKQQHELPHSHNMHTHPSLFGQPASD